MWHFAGSNVFLVEGLIVALGKFCTSLIILPRKMGIDFYTYKLRCLTKYYFLVDPFVVTNQANRSRLLGKFITEVRIALAEVTLELQGSFTLEMHLVLINLQG